MCLSKRQDNYFRDSKHKSNSSSSEPLIMLDLDEPMRMKCKT